LLDIDTSDAMATVIGMGLGVNFGNHGSTWSDDIGNLWSINAADDVLYQIDVMTGVASYQADLDVAFSTVGIEWHPANGMLYACTDGHLYEVDPTDGSTVEIGNLGHGCTNLAAQWTAIPCIDDA
jgi:hypothetical protein